MSLGVDFPLGTPRREQRLPDILTPAWDPLSTEYRQGGWTPDPLNEC